MPTLTSGEIGNIGERYASLWLETKGYRCSRNTQLPGSTDIEADGSLTSLLIQVKTAVYPQLAAYISAEEKQAIVTRASWNSRQAWLAQLQINNQGQLVGEIKWTRLD